jgi:hypothetical protein
MRRSYSGVGGVLAGILALILSPFCGPISCNMSIRDVHPQIGTSTHLYKKVTCFETSHLFIKRSVVSKLPTWLWKTHMFRKRWDILDNWVVSGRVSCFGMTLGILGCLSLFRNRYPYLGTSTLLSEVGVFLNSSKFLDNHPDPEMSTCLCMWVLFCDKWVVSGFLGSLWIRRSFSVYMVSFMNKPLSPWINGVVYLPVTDFERSLLNERYDYLVISLHPLEFLECFVHRLLQY